MLLSELQNIGITDTELKIYEFLVKNGEVAVSALVSGTKIKRPTVYKSLYSLSEKNLVTLIDIKKKIHAKPEPPTRLVEMAEKKSEEIESIKAKLLTTVTAFNQLYTHSTEKPVVSVFEEVGGLKKIYEDMIAEKQTIYALVQTGEVESELFKWLTTTFVRKRKRERVHSKVIVASGFWSKEYQKRNTDELRTTIEIPFSKFPIEHEVDVFGNKVAFIHYKKDEPLIGVVIHHPGIARTAKAWFDLAWLGALTYKT